MRSTAALILLILVSCEAAPSAYQADNSSRRAAARKITGVLTLFTEGQSFQECPLKEPWNCFEAKGPECGFDATPEAYASINAEIAKARAGQRFATFGIVMLGTRVDGIASGHLDAYGCEFRARSVLRIKEVPSVPPDPSLTANVR